MNEEKRDNLSQPVLETESQPNKKMERRSTAWNIFLGLVGFLIVLIILIVIFSSSIENTLYSITHPEPTSNLKPTPDYSFDVPALMGKNIDEIRTILVPSYIHDPGLTNPTQEQINQGVTEWKNTFTDDYTQNKLDVYFNITSRQVVYFYYSENSWPPKNTLIKHTNTTENASNYTIKEVRSEEGNKTVVGIKIFQLR